MDTTLSFANAAGPMVRDVRNVGFFVYLLETQRISTDLHLFTYILVVVCMVNFHVSSNVKKTVGSTGFVYFLRTVNYRSLS